jgi:hypothetical protein
VLIELAPLPGHRDHIIRKVKPACLVGGLRLEHAIPGLGSAPGFRDYDDEGFGQSGAEGSENAVHPTGIRVVEKVNIDRGVLRKERFRNELGTERGAADPHDEKVSKRAIVRGLDLPRENPGRERGNLGVDVTDPLALFGWSEFGRAKPVVADRSPFIRVHHLSRLDRRAIAKCFRNPGLHLLRPAGGRVHSAGIKSEADLGVSDHGIPEGLPIAHSWFLCSTDHRRTQKVSR